MSKLRRAGARWRVLAHEPDGRSLSVETYPKDHSGGLQRVVDASGTEFDELVVGQFFHMEQMDSGVWWMNIGGVTVWVKADRDGRPLSVDVFEPGAYAEPVDGVKYGGAVAPAPAPERPA